MSRNVPFPSRVMAAALVGVMAAAVPFPTAAATDEDPASKNWRLGPVKYLLTKAEAKKFKSLKTPRQREEFVAAFWEQRDPTPGTEPNEFRDDFGILVEQANQMFASTRGGWATDQGRVHILLGPPADRKTVQNPDGSMKQLVWLYDDSTPVGRDFEVIFRPEEGVGLALANIREVDQIVLEVPELVGLGEKIAAAPKAAAVPARPAAAPEAPAAPATVSDAALRLLDGLAGGGAGRHEIRFQARWDFFEAPTGKTHAVLTLGVIPPPAAAGQTGDGEYEVFARLVPASAGLDTVDLTGLNQFGRSDLLEQAPTGPFRPYQARQSITPGAYTLFAGVRNRTDGRAGTLEETVNVPAFSPSDLSLSSITMATSISRSSVDPDGGETLPFEFGFIHIVPRLEPVFRPGDNLDIFYQVYHAATKPGTATYDLNIEYKILKKTGSRFQEDSAPPDVKKNHTVNFDVWGRTLEGWPSNDYRLRITVTDNIAGRTTAREIDFRVQ